MCNLKPTHFSAKENPFFREQKTSTVMRFFLCAKQTKHNITGRLIVSIPIFFRRCRPRARRLATLTSSRPTILTNQKIIMACGVNFFRLTPHRRPLVLNFRNSLRNVDVCNCKLRREKKKEKKRKRYLAKTGTEFRSRFIVAFVFVK